MRKFVQMLVAALVAAPAFGAPTTWTFTGVVDINDVPGGAVGQTVTGSLTIDTSALYLQDTDGSTYKFMTGYFYGPSCAGACTPQQTNPLQVSGKYIDGSQKFSIGGSAEDYGEVGIFRRYKGGIANQFLVHGRSNTPNLTQTVIVIFIQDELGANTNIFKDLEGGLDINQGIDWLAAGAYKGFQAYEYDNSTDEYLFLQEGSLRSVVVSVPEPATLALVGMALFGLAGARRYRQSLSVSGRIE